MSANEISVMRQKNMFIHMIKLGNHPKLIYEVFTQLFDTNCVSLGQIYKWWYHIKKNRRFFKIPQIKKRRTQRRTSVQ